MKLSEAILLLKDAGIDSAEHDARELFRAYAGIEATAYIGRDSECDAPELTSAVARRAKREPLQYILGKVGFFREEYTVTEAVLIPRADTEHLVDYAVRHIPDGERFIDICTGSGCIAISTLRNTIDTTADAVDVSPEALAVARMNAEANGVADRLTLAERDVFKMECDEEQSYYAVLSNPPYVTETAYAELEPEIYCEPSIAFLGGADGGDFYRAILKIAKRMIKPEGFIALEIGFDQGALLTRLAEEHALNIEIIKDYSGLDRVAVLRHGEPRGGTLGSLAAPRHTDA